MLPTTTTPTYTTYSSSYSSGENVIRGWDTEQDSQVMSNIDISSLGKNDFMKLLLAQMQHQDPLNPADNTEFVAQLAQFSSLEQMTTMNTNLEESLKNNSVVAEAVNNAMMISYIGKEITATSSTFFYDGETPVDLTFTADRDISTGTLYIKSQDGLPVLEIALDGFAEGENTVEWNGVTGSGGNAKPGVYSFTIEAFDVLGGSVDNSSSFSGVVDGVSFKKGEAHLKIGSVLVPFSSVHEIKEKAE